MQSVNLKQKIPPPQNVVRGYFASWNMTLAYYNDQRDLHRGNMVYLDGTRGYALVEGGEAYEVEFEYRNGEISRLICSCFCSCK